MLLKLQQDMGKHASWMTELKEQMRHRIQENMAFFKQSAGFGERSMVSTSVEGGQ